MSDPFNQDGHICRPAHSHPVQVPYDADQRNPHEGSADPYADTTKTTEPAKA